MAGKKSFKHFKRDLNDHERRLVQLYENDLPRKVAEKAEELVLKSFRQEKYQDKYSTSWPARKNDKDPGRALLVQSGDLRRSIEVTRSGTMIKISSDKTVGNWNLAQIHNEGLRPVPKRQFMPIPGEQNQMLDEQIGQWLDDQFDELFN